jgi:hypothetical protein
MIAEEEARLPPLLSANAFMSFGHKFMCIFAANRRQAQPLNSCRLEAPGKQEA